jgi:hypothetical protein
MALNFGTAEPRNESGPVALPKHEGRTRPKFMLVLDPNCYIWDPGVKEYLIDLMKLPLMPGLQGVQEGGDASIAIAFHSAKGRTVLRDGDKRLAIPGDKNPMLADGRYRARWIANTHTPGKGVYCYGWAWEGYERVMNNIVWGEDISAKRRLQRHVVAVGLVADMTVQMRGAYMQRVIDRVKRLERRAENAAQQRQLDAARLYLADVVEDYKKHGGKIRGTAADLLTRGLGPIDHDLTAGAADTDAEVIGGLEIEGDVE